MKPWRFLKKYGEVLEEFHGLYLVENCLVKINLFRGIFEFVHIRREFIPLLEKGLCE